jgi:hypothetical protein
MQLGEWHEWWKRSGARQLDELLHQSWDPFQDDSFRLDTQDQLVVLARNLHEGATRIDVQAFLHDLRRTQWPDRVGRKWTTRDRVVAEKVLAWYREVTGEQPVDK